MTSWSQPITGQYLVGFWPIRVHHSLWLWWYYCGTRWTIVDYSGVTMKYWLALGQRGHTFNDRQHFWCSPRKKWSEIITKTKYKSRVITSPGLSFLLRNPDIYGVTFNTFNGQFVSYFMASTIKLNCCAANVCISPSPHRTSQLNYSLFKFDPKSLSQIQSTGYDRLDMSIWPCHHQWPNTHGSIFNNNANSIRWKKMFRGSISIPSNF